MLVGLISDTHGYLDPQVLTLFARADHILHAGDVGAENVLAELRLLAPLTAVRGNVDLALAQLPDRADVVLEGVAVHLVHRPEDALPPPAARVVVVGHTHVAAVQERHGVLFVNPGAAGRQGFHRTRTAGLLRLEDGRTDVEIVTLGPKARL